MLFGLVRLGGLLLFVYNTYILLLWHKILRMSSMVLVQVPVENP